MDSLLFVPQRPACEPHAASDKGVNYLWYRGGFGRRMPRRMPPGRIFPPMRMPRRYFRRGCFLPGCALPALLLGLAVIVVFAVLW